MTLVSMPRVDLTRYHGVFAPNSTSRAPITPARRGQRNSEPADKAPTALLLTPLGTDPEWFMTPAEHPSCRRQTHLENTPNIAQSLTVPTLYPLTDRVMSGDCPA